LGIRDRLRRMVGRPKQQPMAFDPQEWRRGADALDSVLERLGVSFVASWEICATNLHNALKDTQGPEVAKVAIERFSDGLVPTQDGIARLQHAVGPELERLTGPGAAQGLAARLDVMAEETAAGWDKTVDYLQPVIDVAKVDVDALQRLTSVGRDVAEAIKKRNRRLVADIPATGALAEALDDYAGGVCTDVEIILDRVRGVLVDAAWLSGADAT
jgi:hypothetical protein